MPTPSWAAIVTAITSGIIALGGLVTAFGVLLPLLRRVKHTEKVAVTTHELVNAKYTDLLRWNALLTQALLDNGKPIPPDLSGSTPTTPTTPTPSS